VTFFLEKLSVGARICYFSTRVVLRLTPHQKDLALLLGGAGGLAAATLALWPLAPRELAAEAALSQLGQSDADPYWKDVLTPGYPPSGYPKDWCGGFVLWALHRADLGLDILWEVGSGFLSRLPTTQHPEVGDVAYFTNNQHHAMIVNVRPDGRLDLVNGNGTGGKVSSSVILPSQAAAFYSIQPLIDAAPNTSGLWLLGGAVLAGVASWKLIR
jgi:hypothetical protein